MDTDTKRPSLVAGILQSRQKAEEPREASQDARDAVPTPMLDIRRSGGEILSFSYAYLTQVSFLPGDTLTLYFGDKKVIIDGRNLDDVREKIRLHKKGFVQEGTEAEGILKPESAEHIDRIDIEPEEERTQKPNETGRSKGHQR